ncbi:hypothetical protein EYF80_060992 [Liparis tanakae]|uniref:Uncharacterized protein n=1 Tax=Liparis tanakae TaxID=230148 RepID=A0A4Z2EJ80_9TELE|nr:hypothetical protein EYF80_060992 [Liparis tanakae]
MPCPRLYVASASGTTSRSRRCSAPTRSSSRTLFFSACFCRCSASCSAACRPEFSWEDTTFSHWA